jgi:hypothetical protein
VISINDQEKKIIVDEINKWRHSKLLPAEYCDFLLNLYSAGNSVPATNNSMNNKPNLSINKIIFSIASMLICAVILFILFNFKSFPLTYKIGLLVLFTSISYLGLIIYKIKGNNPIVLLLVHNIASMIMVFCVLYVVSELGYSNLTSGLLGIFMLVFIVWLVTALWLNHLIIFIASLIGISLVYNYFVLINVTNNAILSSEAYWIPLSLIVLWIAYSTNQSPKYYKHSIILLILGVFYFIMPEISVLYRGDLVNELLVPIVIKTVMLLIGVYVVYKNIHYSNKNNMEA